MIFNRDILKENFTCISPQFNTDMTRDEFCDYIDKWKAYLVNECGLYKGSIVINSMVLGELSHFAFFFACAELGIKHAGTNYPYMNDFMDISLIKRLKVDAVFNDSLAKNYYHQNKILQIVEEIVENGGGKIYWEDEIDILNYNEKQLISDPGILPSDTLQITYTSGRSGENSKICNITHEYAMAVGERNIDVFNISDTLAIHTNNLHHARSLTTYFIPALMSCEEHRFYNIPNNTIYWPPELVENLKQDFIRPERKIVLVQSTHVMNALEDNFEFLNTEFIQHRVTEYGETDGPHCLFVNNRLVDNFYDLILMDDGTTLVNCHCWKDWHVLDDKFEKNGDEFHIIGRRSEHPLTDQVSELLNVPFEILTKEGRTYLAIFSREDIHIDEYLKEMFDDVQIVHPNAFTSDNSRQWWALKEMFHRSQYPDTDWDYWEERRIKGTDSLDNLVPK